MTLESQFAPRVSMRAMFVIAVLAFLALPSFVQSAKTEARAGSNDEASATPPRANKQESAQKLLKDHLWLLEVHGDGQLIKQSCSSCHDSQLDVLTRKFFLNDEKRAELLRLTERRGEK
jgi:hypothetical protein